MNIHFQKGVPLEYKVVSQDEAGRKNGKNTVFSTFFHPFPLFTFVTMRQAIFLTGFNNWGKSSLIFELFGNQTRFWHGYTYGIVGVNFTIQFTVQSQSNDDLGPDYVDKIIERLGGAPDGGDHLFSALCPSLEEGNSFVEILTHDPFTTYDRLHLLLLEFKWEHNARLLINNIVQAGQRIHNAQFHVINADQALTNDDQRWNAKLAQIRGTLNNIFGTP